MESVSNNYFTFIVLPGFCDFLCKPLQKKEKNSPTKSNFLRFIDNIQRETLKVDNFKARNLSKVGSAVSVLQSATKANVFF